MVPLGENLARLRHNRALTQESLAERAGISVDLIKKLEQRQRDSARLTTLRALATALGVEVADLTSAEPPRDAADPIDLAPIRSTMEGMTVDDLADLRQTIASLVALDTAHGSTGLDRVGVRAFTDARRRLATVHAPDALTAECVDAVAELGQLAAWLLHDAGKDQAAHALLAESLSLATTAGTGPDRAELMILDQLSMLATFTGAWAEALRLAERTAAMAEGASTRVQAMTRIRRGRALALGGHRAGLAELRRAASLLDDSVHGDDPPWTWWVTSAEVTVHHAIAASDLGDHHHAVDLAHTAVASLDPHQQRDQVIFQAVLLRTAAKAGAWGDVTAAAESLRTSLPGAGSARAVGMVRLVVETLSAGTPGDVVGAVRAALDAGEDRASP